MKLKRRTIEEFKEIYFGETGERISDKEAEELTQNLLSIFKLICRPIPKEGEESRQEEAPKALR